MIFNGSRRQDSTISFCSRNPLKPAGGVCEHPTATQTLQIQGRTNGLSDDPGGYKAGSDQDKGEAEAEKAESDAGSDQAKGPEVCLKNAKGSSCR